jgi:hypothetical protein
MIIILYGLWLRLSFVVASNVTKPAPQAFFAKKALAFPQFDLE